MRAALLAAIGVAVLSGCGGGQARPQRASNVEYLEAIQIEGNRAIASGELVSGLQLERTREGGRAVDPYQLSIDTDRIRALYLRAGFFDVTVTSRIALKARAQTVVFTVVEGPRAKLRVVIQGLPPEVPEAAARALVRLPDGAPFDYAVYDEAKQPMVALVENAGYPRVVIDAAVLADRQTGVATARFAIEAGPRATFGEVTIAGVGDDLAGAIRGRLAFAPGATYSAKALTESQRRIYDLGRFTTVRLDIDRTAGTVVPVHIAVVLGPRREIKLGLGAGLEPEAVQARARVSGSLIPLSRPLWTLAADLRPSVTIQTETRDVQQRHRALATASRLDLLWPNMRGELSVALEYITVEAYTSTGPRVGAALDSPLGVPWLLGRAGWVLEYLAFLDPKVDEPVRAELGLNDPQRRGAYELSVTAEGRDNPLEAHRGAYASLRASFGTPAAGGAETYLQLTPEARAYLPLGPFVLAGKARAGVIWGEAPVTERYYSGGASSHRGFADRRLSPVAQGEVGGEPGLVVIGGTALVETGAELRFPLSFLFEPLGGQLFLDGGDVTVTPGELDVTNLFWAAGVGLYFKFKGVKFRVDVGYRLNRKEPGQLEYGEGVWENLSLHFGVGEAY